MNNNNGNAGWNLLGNMINLFFTLKAIPMIILILVVYYGISAIGMFQNNNNADESYISSSDYSKYVIDIAKNTTSPEIQLDYEKSLNNSNIDTVYLYYDFISEKDYNTYEEIAYKELEFVYNSIKDTKIKKEKIAYPNGEDISFSFNKTENGKQLEIGRATIFYFFGKLQADEYLNKTETIISEHFKQ